MSTKKLTETRKTRLKDEIKVLDDKLRRLAGDNHVLSDEALMSLDIGVRRRNSLYQELNGGHAGDDYIAVHYADF